MPDSAVLSTTLPPSEDGVEVVQFKGYALRPAESPSSLSSCRRRSSERPSTSSPPAVLIHGWLLSFSHYIALYAMLVARLGTRCDCRKLRAKSEVVRRRSVEYARKCQDGILPIVMKPGPGVPTTLLNPQSSISRWYSRRGSKRSNIEDYYRMFFLHCTCLEFFIEQLLRTAQLFQSFSLNVGRSLTSSLVAPPENFIYSGLADVERPRRRRSRLLPHRNREEGNTFVNDSLSGIELELASKTSLGQTQSGEQENHSFETAPPSSNTLSLVQITEPTDLRGILKLKHIFKPTPTVSTYSTASVTGGPGAAPLNTPSKYSKTKGNPPVPISQHENKKRVRESDAECFEKLIEDIRLIRSLIVEIQTEVSVNPWATRKGKRHRKKHSNYAPCSGDHPGPNRENKDEEEEEEEEEGSFARDEDFDDDDDDDDEDYNWFQEECDFVQQKDTAGVSGNKATRFQYGYQSSAFCWWKLRFRNACLRRVMGGQGPPGGFEEKTPEDDETVLSKRLRRKQYICLSLIIVFSIGLFGSALGSCIYLLA